MTTLKLPEGDYLSCNGCGTRARTNVPDETGAIKLWEVEGWEDAHLSQYDRFPVDFCPKCWDDLNAIWCDNHCRNTAYTFDNSITGGLKLVVWMREQGWMTTEYFDVCQICWIDLRMNADIKGHVNDAPRQVRKMLAYDLEQNPFPDE